MPAHDPPIVAAPDPTLSAVLDGLAPLLYSAGAAPEEDLPGHVRAASSIRRLGEARVVVMDDTLALAVVTDAGVAARLLPRGPGGRRVFDDTLGNKSDKLDLEASLVLPDGRFVALGSGSSARRERLVVLDGAGGVRVVDGAALYAALRAEAAFAGSELNVEGALVRGDTLVLFQRGNGAARGPRAPVNALGELATDAFVRWIDGAGPPPRLRRVTPLELGALDGVPLGVTDAAALADGRVAVLACAEASPDAVSDGPVTGCCLGLLEGRRLRTARIEDPRGAPVRLKLEGLEPRPGEALTFDVVVDVDRPDVPALAGTLTVHPIP